MAMRHTLNSMNTITGITKLAAYGALLGGISAAALGIGTGLAQADSTVTASGTHQLQSYDRGDQEVVPPRDHPIRSTATTAARAPVTSLAPLTRARPIPASNCFFPRLKVPPSTPNSKVKHVTQVLTGDEAADNFCEDCGYEPELKRTLNGFQVFAISFASLSVAVGIFATYDDVLRDSGPVGIWLFPPIVAIGQILVALVYAQFAARIPLSGSSYAWRRGWPAPPSSGGPSAGWPF